jgi:intracellular sulfur oxidation DsrE/DsrF family protein
MSIHDGDVVVHITGDDAGSWEMALRNLVNLVRDGSVDTPPESISVVANGPAVKFFTAKGPEADRIEQMVSAGVSISACSNSLQRFGYATDDLADGVTVVDSGVAAVMRAQERNLKYLKLP